MKIRIAVIISKGRLDFMTGTILDGLVQLKKENPSLEFFISESQHDWRHFSIKGFMLKEEKFIEFAKQADLIFLMWGKDGVNRQLMEKIGRWDKVIFIDGSELGRDRRFDAKIQRKVLEGKYKSIGMINAEMLGKCAFYFRREKPYIKGIIPLLFGIESRYLSRYQTNRKKDIDFFCVFGQEKYPIMRKHVKEILIDFCQRNGFSCQVEQTDNEKFYELLARSKVGVSVGGGGFDTARFWEILANNCLLLTEKIDIFLPDSLELDYSRIWQFNNLFDFRFQLEKIAGFLKSGYQQKDLEKEYNKILTKHSSQARVIKVLKTAKILI